MRASVSASTEEVGSSRIKIGSIEQDGAGYGKSLLLPFRQGRSLLADDRIITLRKTHDRLMDSRQAGGIDNLFFGGFGPAIS